MATHHRSRHSSSTVTLHTHNNSSFSSSEVFCGLLSTRGLVRIAQAIVFAYVFIWFCHGFTYSMVIPIFSAMTGYTSLTNRCYEVRAQWMDYGGGMGYWGPVNSQNNFGIAGPPSYINGNSNPNYSPNQQTTAIPASGRAVPMAQTAGPMTCNELEENGRIVLQWGQWLSAIIFFIVLYIANWIVNYLWKYTDLFASTNKNNCGNSCGCGQSSCSSCSNNSSGGGSIVIGQTRRRRGGGGGNATSILSSALDGTSNGSGSGTVDTTPLVSPMRRG